MLVWTSELEKKKKKKSHWKVETGEIDFPSA